MCRPVPCNKCGKTTWAGCGEHIEQVKAQVAPGDWCTCPRDEKSSGFFRSLFGR